MGFWPAPMAGLPVSRAIVSVGPPLSASGPSSGWSSMRSERSVLKPIGVVPKRLCDAVAEPRASS